MTVLRGVRGISRLKMGYRAVACAILFSLFHPTFPSAGEGWVYSQDWFEELYANCDLSSSDPYVLAQCIGHATELCAARTPEGSTLAGYLSCIKQEATSWDLLWDKHKPEIFAHLDLLDRVGGRQEGNARRFYAQSQADWRTHLLSHCAFEASLQPNPNLRENDEAYCILDGTARRVQFLLEITQIQ